jgi:pSer/pThr/pTyr-binding forkhead associated (FHA) protein
MTFVLRHADRDFLLGEAEFSIGRSLHCDLPLDDPLVSRSHALVTVVNGQLFVQDLGSRNGVRVNDQSIVGRRLVSHGDRIGIGEQDLIVIQQSDIPKDTLTRGPSTERKPSHDVLFSLANKALRLGQAGEAERLLQLYLEDVHSSVRAGQKESAENVARAALYAVKLARSTHKAGWLEFVFDLYEKRSEVCPLDVVDALYDAVRHVDRRSLIGLRSYLEELKKRSASLGPSERFLVGRLEGLQKLAG